MANNNNVSIKANIDGVDELIRALKTKQTLRVGILGANAKAQHSDSGLTNAELGTFHEFGTKKMPQRSFLEAPLRAKMADAFEDIKPQAMKKFLKHYKVEDFLDHIGSVAVHIIEDAFKNGFPGWESLTAATQKQKAKKGLSPLTLVGTGQLSNSISFKVYKR